MFFCHEFAQILAKKYAYQMSYYPLSRPKLVISPQNGITLSVILGHVTNM